MSTADTIAVMERLAAQDEGHPAVLKFAGDVRHAATMRAARSSRPERPIDLVAALEDLISERIAYVPDPTEGELIRSPAYMLTEDPQGDCDDQMTLAKATATALGLRSHFLRLGPASAELDPYLHVVLVVPGAQLGEAADLVLDSTVTPAAQPAILAGLPMRHLHPTR